MLTNCYACMVSVVLPWNSIVFKIKTIIIICDDQIISHAIYTGIYNVECSTVLLINQSSEVERERGTCTCTYSLGMTYVL